RVEKRVQRDPFVRYLIDRANHENAVGDAIEQVASAGGVQTFLLLGPENECPDEFLERLRRHTSPQRLDGRCWLPVRVEWPFECAPAQFADEYRRRLAVRLRLPSSAGLDAMARALAQHDRPVAAVSLMHAEEWGLPEPKRIRSWVSWWQTLANDAIRFSAIPILCVKMPAAKPGWKGCPRGAGPGATVSNVQIWREAQRLRKPPWGFRLLPFLGARQMLTFI